MKSLWNDKEASGSEGDPLRLRVYTSRLLGQEPSLVLHGGGNTSVKTTDTTLFGDREELLYIKGSGWDLATIESAGFAPVRLQVLTRMAEGRPTSARWCGPAGRNDRPQCSTPSVEAILHAILVHLRGPHHADAVVAMAIHRRRESARSTRTRAGSALCHARIRAGAKGVRAESGLDWSRYEGMVLLHHGIFSWGNDARSSYERMIGWSPRRKTISEEQGLDRGPSVTSSTAHGVNGVGWNSPGFVGKPRAALR